MTAIQPGADSTVGAPSRNPSTWKRGALAYTYRLIVCPGSAGTLWVGRATWHRLMGSPVPRRPDTARRRSRTCLAHSPLSSPRGFSEQHGDR